MKKVGMLAIFIVAFVATLPAVPRYSAPVAQVGDSSTIKSAEAATQNPCAPALERIKQDALSCKDEWSGSLDDLKAMVDRAKQKYGFENTKHQGRNATMLIPANQREMNRILESGDVSTGRWLEGNVFNKDSWPALGTGYHAHGAERTDGELRAIKNTMGSGVKKFIVRDGDFRGAEVVYDKGTGKIVKNWRMGTRNFAYITDPEGDHDELDVDTHRSNSQYKYVGILFETDLSNPNKYYIVNGQTGRRMTWREAEDFPTTLSDEWKDMGLVCAADDSKEVIEPDECRDMAMCIDTSKLEELLKEGILFLKGLIAKGKRATNSQIDAHNQRVKEMLAETVSIVKRIDSLGVSDEEKKSIAGKVFESVKGLNSQFDSLNKQARSMGLVRGATTEEQIELITDVQGKADVVSVDLSKSETESIKSKSNDVSYNPDFDVCKCAVPDDRDFRCKKCGKMSKCLAPYRDKEFERMLNNRK